MRPLPSLRTRTEFTFRKTFAPVKKVVARLQELAVPAAGIVDLGGTWGHGRWARATKGTAVRPLFGTEFVVPVGEFKPTTWVLAAETKGFYNFTSATLREGADIPSLLAERRSALVRFAGDALSDPELFDYVDINPAMGPLALRRATRLALTTNKPVVVTQDNFYSAPEDVGAFGVIGGGERTTPQYILPTEVLRRQFPQLDEAAWARACASTFEAADRCASVLPTAPIINFPGDLRALVLAGKEERLRLGHLQAWDDAYEARMQRELDVIAAKSFESYFLVVSDLIRYTKQHMLVGPARGSSAGSLVCWLLRITEVDPIPHGLIFERFIDLNRNDLPDIDIDFSDSKREMVFTYLAEKYGQDNVARIGSINTLGARSAVSRIVDKLGIPQKEKFDIFNVLITYSSGDSRYGHALEDTMTQTEPGKRFAANYPEALELTGIEGHATHTGIHAAGVIVSNEPVIDYCTVGPDGVAQLDKPDSEMLNLLKIDALGLRTLGVIEDAGVVTADQLYALKLDDPKVFEMFNQKRYSGIFQFEGSTQRRVAAEVHIDHFDKIEHVTALARPGPLGGGASQKYIARAAGREEFSVKHPLLEPIVLDTQGVVLHQEQVMRIVREIGKFSWEETSSIRKAMSGRKGTEYFDQKGKQFIEGAAESGINAALAKQIWDEICSFGAWGMNRCVSEDTEVRLARKTNAGESSLTIKQLYERNHKFSLWSLQGDGRIRWSKMVAVHKNGKKICNRYTFSCGSSVTCTPEHKFLIDGSWQPIGKAEVGSEFAAMAPTDKVVRREKLGLNWMAGRKSSDPKYQAAGQSSAAWIDGRASLFNQFRNSNLNAPCEDCDCKKARMEAHHNDFERGVQRPGDLAWLCPSCHAKRHRAHGNRLSKGERGRPTKTTTLVEIQCVGEKETYDIEMPDPHHNYVLANGIVTHNSHTVSYATISYWVAWLKVYFPLEYAAACLRNAKDDEQIYELLRDMKAEGVQYTAFDAATADVDWAVVDGELIGGFMNLVGYGPAKAVAAVEQRRLGKLDLDKVSKAQVKFTELYPLRAAYGDMYDNPQKYGVRAGSYFSLLDDLPERGDVLIICSVTKKELRDENEAVRLQRREGKRVEGNSLFLDVFVTDDTGVPLTLRVDRFMFEPLGQRMAEELQVGDHLMVRGRRIPNFAMIKVERIKCLNRKVAL